MTLRRRSGLTAALATVVCLAGPAFAAVEELGRHVEHLASTERADYIMEQLEAIDAVALPGQDGYRIPFELDPEGDREARSGFNIVGLLPATGEASGKYLVIGAHDANAPDAAAVLSVGKRLAARERKHPVLLAFWTGEESGVLGSTEFVKGGTIPDGHVAAYINLDRVGRMKENRLTLQSVGSSSAWPRLIEQSNVPIGFDVDTQDDPHLHADSTTFYQAGIPALNVFAGSHENHPKPSDTAERINLEDLERISRFVALLAGRLDRLEAEPEYLTVARATQAHGSRHSARPFTGTVPDYGAEVEGLLLNDVIAGGPAEKAGLKGGDIIVELAGRKITNVYDYADALDALKVDVTVKVVFMRDGKRQETEITPSARR